MIQYEKLGIFLSKPIAFALVFIYMLQSGLLVYLIQDKFELEKQISFQQKRIDGLEERLQIYRAIDDFQFGFNNEEVSELTEVIYTESRKYEYDPMFVLAVIMTESSFMRSQVSSKGARGLMQVIPFVGKDVAPRAGVEWEGNETLHEPTANIKLGTLHLFEMILKFKDLEKALVAYNMGETRLRRLMRENKPIPSRYLNKVMEHYRMLKETYQA